MEATSTVGNGSTQKQHKIGKPKRPLTAYNIFFKEQREKIIAQRGGNSGGFATLARMVASRWKSIEDEELHVFQRKSNDDKLRYENEMALWLSRSQTQPANTNSPRSSNRPGAPRKGTIVPLSTTCHGPVGTRDHARLWPRHHFHQGHTASALQDQGLSGVHLMTPRSASDQVVPRVEESHLARVVFSPGALEGVFETALVGSSNHPHSWLYADLDKETKGLLDRMLSQDPS